MPYIETSKWVDICLTPLPGENFQAFNTRVLPALQALEPYMLDHDARVKEAWAAYVLSNATEVTVKLKRDVELYSGSWYLEGYYGDWTVAEVLEANTMSFATTSTTSEMATAGTGDVFKIAKSAEDEQLVFGWANIAIDAAGEYPLDWDGDITDPSDLEKAAYNFVLKYRATGEQHQGEAKGELVESIMFTKEKQQALGIPEGTLPEGWWVGFHVPDKEVFAKIKSGEYQMFSVEGTAIRDPLQAEGGE